MSHSKRAHPRALQPRTRAVASTLALLLPLFGCGGDAEPSAANGGLDAGGQDEPGECAFIEAVKQGEGTYYAADGSGNCGFPASPGDLLVGAMNTTDYAGSAVCGACAEVTGPQGSVRVRIVDRCPECAPGDIDLSPQAFEQLAPLKDGRVPIQWHYVPCEVSGGVVYHFKDGSNPWWVAVQVRNHRLPIEKLESRGADGAFHALTRLDYNYFVADSGLGEGPFTFRATDIEGQQLESADVPLLDNRDAPTSQQFPACL
jgi:expansin (peptidoglycan-binding protein)